MSPNIRNILIKSSPSLLFWFYERDIILVYQCICVHVGYMCVDPYLFRCISSSWWLLTRFWSRSATWMWRITLLSALRNRRRSRRNWSGSRPSLPNQSGFWLTHRLLSDFSMLLTYISRHYKPTSIGPKKHAFPAPSFTTKKWWYLSKLYLMCQWWWRNVTQCNSITLFLK